ncbi:hypothetical protein [Clostridium septicum]|uniref:Uncharacterized protein n=1 Tax=Clostridium septicum TaxID=1504 RepID=A0A9N7JI62_CLOSE|nr:hypothetical protein [Clostridium septicum]AYE32948.1 hypothetical protein CP523_00030 [Clostridium septicum]MDU1315067.1 hypothetical protein [Clostridium septicum]QAS61121.1 hypothetical protein EI377_10515 [Clostridium septicum]UEC19538.1 hypothetical protein LK444_08875 [Clostridium septicum]USS02401.1 hypothetical protein NH397_08310 [Clostridium septicum]
MKNSTIIDNVANQTNLPKWWVESIAIQYFNPREITLEKEDNLWKLDYSKLDEDELAEAAIYKKSVISNYKIFHNIKEKVFYKRYIGDKRNIENRDLLLKEYDEIIANGLVSKYYVAFKEKEGYIESPENILNSYYQVLDNENIYQWKVLDSIRYCEETFNFNYVNEIFSLQEKHDYLVNLLIRSEEVDEKEIRDKTEEYLEWCNVVKRSLAKTLYDAHLARLSRIDENNEHNINKVIKEEPPLISSYENFTLKDGIFKSNHNFSGFFYKKSLEHLKKAKYIEEVSKSDKELLKNIDNLYNEKLLSLIMGLKCVETYINSIGNSYFKDIWDETINFTLKSKIRFYLKLTSRKVDLDEEYKDITNSIYNLVNLYDEFINSNMEFKESYIENNIIITTLGVKLSDRDLNNIDIILNEFIVYLSKKCNIKLPCWIKIK